jgi:hypothetical protein
MGSVCWGGGVNFHAEYHLQIVPEDSTASWTIYRRYSAFEKLHWCLFKKLGEEKMKEFDLVLPAKNYFGSRLNTFNDTMAQRKIELQTYLDIMLAKEEFSDDVDFFEFVDVAGKGMSGIILEVGADKVIREAFVRVKILKSFPIGIWEWCFLFLLRDGTLYVLSSKYDRRQKALATWMLTGQDVRVVPNASNYCIAVSSTKHDLKVKIRFDNVENASFWLRNISEFASSASYQNLVATKARHEQVKSPKKESYKVVNAVAEPTIDVHARGTGNTVDELSSMYGI